MSLPTKQLTDADSRQLTIDIIFAANDMATHLLQTFGESATLCHGCRSVVHLGDGHRETCCVMRFYRAADALRKGTR